MKQHKWVALVQINLTEAEADECMRTGIIPKEVHEENMPVQVGCYDCEKELRDAWGKPCELVTEEK